MEKKVVDDATKNLVAEYKCSARQKWINSNTFAELIVALRQMEKM